MVTIQAHKYAVSVLQSFTFCKFSITTPCSSIYILAENLISIDFEQDHANRSLISTCQDSGLFAFTKARCAPIPCLDADIINITQTDGLFVTEDEGPINVGESVTFLCTDEERVPNDDNRAEIQVNCLLGKNTIAKLEQTQHIFGIETIYTIFCIFRRIF